MANQFLRNMKLPNLVDLLDNLIIIPLDSATLEEAFHTQGVNMRYLGKIASLSKLKHVKDICVTDMLARVLKRLFNTQMSQSILNRNKRQVEIH
jgi:protein TIF31